MKKHEEVLKKVLERIKPPERELEEISSKTKEFLKKIKERISSKSRKRFLKKLKKIFNLLPKKFRGQDLQDLLPGVLITIAVIFLWFFVVVCFFF